MFNIHDLTPKDQAVGQKKPHRHKRRKCINRALQIVVNYATEPSAPTLQQAQEAAAGCLARLLVSHFQQKEGAR